MITRYMFVRLNTECRGRAGEIAAHIRATLALRGGWHTCEVGVPADGHAAKGWDLSVVLGFDDKASESAFGGYDAPGEAIEAWGGEGVVVDVVKAWNFETAGA